MAFNNRKKRSNKTKTGTGEKPAHRGHGGFRGRVIKEKMERRLENNRPRTLVERMAAKALEEQDNEAQAGNKRSLAKAQDRLTLSGQVNPMSGAPRKEASSTGDRPKAPSTETPRKGLPTGDFRKGPEFNLSPPDRKLLLRLIQAVEENTRVTKLLLPAPESQLPSTEAPEEQPNLVASDGTVEMSSEEEEFTPTPSNPDEGPNTVLRPVDSPSPTG